MFTNCLTNVSFGGGRGELSAADLPSFLPFFLFFFFVALRIDACCFLPEPPAINNLPLFKR